MDQFAPKNLDPSASTPRRPAGAGFSSADFSSADIAKIDAEAKQIGRELFAALKPTRSHIFQRRWWDDRIMAWSMRDEALKARMFRFVDVLPMLRTSKLVSKHLYEYLDPVSDKLPLPLRFALGAAKRIPFTSPIVAFAAKKGAMDLAKRFIAGTNVKEVLAAAQRQRDHRRAFTLDILGEAVTSEQEAEHYFNAYLSLLESVSPVVNEWKEVPQIDRDAHGPIPRMNLSIKLSALDSQFDAIDPKGTTDRVGRRLRKLLDAARRCGAFLNIDMESYEKKSLTLEIFKTILHEDAYRDVTNVGIVIQCYLREAERDLHSLRDWAAQRGAPVWVRLVKGAYWDHETAHAQQHGWPIPVFQQKWQSDANYERLTRFLLLNHEHLRAALGSHNLRSIAYGMAVAKHLQLPQSALELQMLYGMADAEKVAIAQRGWRMRVYMPYGELIPGMAYLVRRLLENTSNDSFLRAGVSHSKPHEELLENPLGDLAEGTGEQELDAAIADDHLPGPYLQANQANGRQLFLHGDSNIPDAGTDTTMPPHNYAIDVPAGFRNEPPIDFTHAHNRVEMEQTLAEVGQRLGGEFKPVIGGQPVQTAERLASVDPSRTSRVVGNVFLAGLEETNRAVAAAKAAQLAWGKLSAKQRGDYLRGAADVMRRRRFELVAWEIYECGKGWREAAGDIDEAIDFCRYYAAVAEQMGSPRGLDVPGEENRFEYLPRGVAAVIAPWNFPLAILTGMTAAALVTGNSVVMKPSEQSMVIASLLMEVFQAAGLPAGVLNYLPGRGEVVGARLVEHPDVAIIAFTGSRSVGLAINAKAAAVSAQGMTQVKRVIAEMGGKNAVIVDTDADLDEAVLGVMKSAFGYQGQKCSACSRAIVVGEVYDAFVTRLIEATRSLKVGPAEDPATSIGPVIDADSLAKVNSYIEIGKREAKLALGTDVGELARQGYFVAPHIFVDVPANSRLAQEEIFGPVLAVIRAADLDEAFKIANGTDYALTAGIFSRSPAHLERARRELVAGNLYINRGITGALVGRQPFGGFKMSGIGSKAGGVDYLLQFVVPRTVTENTMRRGFVAES